MANEQGWRDFGQITSMIENTISNIQQVNNTINRLKHDSVEIINDPIRLAEITKIIDINPFYTTDGIVALIQKGIDLQTFLIDNGYV